MELIKIETTNGRIEELKMVAKEFKNLGVIAGGAVLDALLDRDYKDIDVFYTAETLSVKQSFVNYAVANGSVFTSIGGGQYSDSAFAESAPVVMFNKTFQIELIEKGAEQLIRTIFNSIQKASGIFTDHTSRPYDVLPADEAFVNKTSDEMQHHTGLGEYDRFLSLYGKLLVNEFDLDIKQIMIDPLTLDVLATPAFIKAFTNKTVDFSNILIFGEGVTRRNLIRILDASNKYDLRLENQEKVFPLIEAMRDFHRHFPVDTTDTTFIKRFTKNLRVPFLVTEETFSHCLDYEGVEHLLTSEPIGSVQMSKQLDFLEIAAHMFDYWVRAMFRGQGTRIKINQYFGSRRSSMSDHFMALARHYDELKDTKLGEFLYTIVQAQNLFNSPHRVIKWVSNPYSDVGLMDELVCNPEEDVCMHGFAPCHDVFLDYLNTHTLEQSIKRIASGLVTTTKEYISYTKKSTQLSSADRVNPLKDMSYFYRFSSDIKKKTDMFDLFGDYLSFRNLEEFETVRYYSLAQGRKRDVRTALNDSKLVYFTSDVVDMEHLLQSTPAPEIDYDDMPW